MPKVYAIDGITPVVEPVGMNAVVNDNAEVGEDAIVAGLAFVKAEARIRQLAGRSHASLREVEALTAPEAGRRRIDIPDSFPLSELKKRHG
jgi:hypothetical protein